MRTYSDVWKRTIVFAVCRDSELCHTNGLGLFSSRNGVTVRCAIIWTITVLIENGALVSCAIIWTRAVFTTKWYDRVVS